MINIVAGARSDIRP